MYTWTHHILTTATLLGALPLWSQEAQASAQTRAGIVAATRIQTLQSLEFVDLGRSVHGAQPHEDQAALFQVQSRGEGFQIQLPQRVQLVHPDRRLVEISNFTARQNMTRQGLTQIDQVHVAASLARAGLQDMGHLAGSFEVVVSYY